MNLRKFVIFCSKVTELWYQYSLLLMLSYMKSARLLPCFTRICQSISLLHFWIFVKVFHCQSRSSIAIFSLGPVLLPEIHLQKQTWHYVHFCPCLMEISELQYTAKNELSLLCILSFSHCTSKLYIKWNTNHILHCLE